MATSSPRNSDVRRVAQLPSAGTQEQQEQQQGTTLSTEYCGETSSTDCIKSGAAQAAMVLQALQEHPAISGMREVADQPQQVALLGDGGGAAAATETDAVTVAGDKQEDERQNNSREQIITHGREHVLLWSVRKGLAPVVAAAVDGFSRGEAVLETPSSAATAPVKKEAATLEDETPRTSAPSSEVSPTHNLCSHRSFLSSSAPSTNAASTSASWCAASTSRTACGTEADDTDNRCFLPAAVRSPAEILAAAAAAASEAALTCAPPAADIAHSTGGPADLTGAARETAQDPSGDNVAAKITPSASVDAAAATASDTSGTAAAPEALATATSADAAAVLCSPAALSLLATPCPVGGAAGDRPACATGAQASVGPDAAAEGTATEKRSVDTAVDTAGITRTAGAAGVTTANVDDAMGENVDAAPAADNEKNAHVKQCETTDCQGALFKDASQELHETLTECPGHEEEHQGGHLQQGGSSEAAGHGAAAADSFSCEKRNWEASFAEVRDARRLSLMTLAVEDLAKSINSGAAAEDETAEVAEKDDATVAPGGAVASEEADLGAVGSLPPPRGKAYRNTEHPGGSLLLWDCRSQPNAPVEDEVAAAAAVCSPPQTSLKVLPQVNEEERQQQQPGRMATGDSSDSLKNVSAGLAPLSATSCCSEYSASPFAAAFKGDISPVSCYSSSSTASVTSPTSSPLSSASCGTLACAAGVTGTAVPAAANEAAAPGEGAARGETATTGPTVAQPSASAAAGEGKGEDANGVSLPDMKTASATASTAATRDSSAPTWYVGFRLPLGAEGRQVLLRRLRRAYHAAPPTTRDAVLASHGLYFSRVPFATVSDLFKLSHLLGVFDFAVQCSHEFGGSGAAGGASVSGGGGGGSHGGKKNHNHGRSANKNGNSNQRQLCSGTGTAGEEGRATGSTAEGVGDALTLAGGIAPTHVGAMMTPAAAAAGGRKSTAAATPRAGVAAAGGHCSDARKAGNGELAEQISSAESNTTARGTSKERAAGVAGDFAEVGVVSSAAGARSGDTGRDASAKNDEEELQAAFKAATAAPRNRVPQQKRSAGGRSSVCRAAARQQQAEQQQQHNLLKEIETPRSVEAAGGRPSGGDRNVHSRNVDWQTQQHILLQQLLQAGLAEQQAGSTGGTDGKSTLEAEALALLNGELGKAAAGAATNAPLPPFAGGGCCTTKETQQQQQQLDEQLLLLQLQEHAKTATASCRRGSSKTVDTTPESRNLRVEQQSQCFLSEAQQRRPRGGLQQQHQQQQATGGENVNGGRTGAKRSCRPADMLLQHEQRQLCSWPPSTPGAGEENNTTWGRQVHEGLMKAQLPSPADLLPFLASAAEQLRNSSYVPPAGAAAARPSYRGSHKSEGKPVLGPALNNDCSGSGSSSSTESNFFDWNGFLMENYLSAVREQPQQQKQQGQTDAMLFSASGSSTSASTRASLVRAASPTAGVAPRQPEPRLQEEEIVQLTKRARTTTTTITTTTTRPAGGALSVAAGHEAAGAGASTGVCAGLLGKEGVSQDYTPEEEALLSALLVAVGSSIREQQQQQRRWTVNTVEEITRLLLQLNNTNSNSGTEEEIRGEGDLVRRMSHLQAKDNSAHGDGGGCKHSSSSNASPCGRAPFSSTTYCGNSVSSCGSTSKDGSGLGYRTSSSKSSSPTSASVSPAENTCTSASLASSSVDAGAATAHHRGAEGATYDFALQSETRGVATHEPQERSSMLPFLQGNFMSATEQQQPQQDSVRRLLTSRGLSGGRSGCGSSVADSAAAGGGSKNRGQIDGSSSRDGHMDVFLQLTSQLQLLSAQVMQQHESQPGQQHHEHPAVEQQYQHHFQTQQACGALQKLVSGPSALPGITAGAQEETVSAVSGRLCSAEKASEYAASVQLMQLVELLQVQHRVSRLLSLFPKAPTYAVSPSIFPASVAAAASPPPSSISAAPLRPAGPPAAAGATLLAPDSAAVTAADAPAATEHFASLLAGLASTILEGKASTANQASETPASTLLGLALGKTDVASLLKGGGNSEPVQEPVDVYDAQQQQQQQRVPLPNRGPGSRGSTTKSSNSKRTANRSSNKGNSTKSSCSKGSNRQGGDRKFSSAVGTELVDDQAAAAAGSGSVPTGRGKGFSEPSAALPKQQEAVVSNYVSHSNSFSTCCSDDVADLCTSRGSSSSSDTKSSHDSSGNLLDGMCSAQPTYDRGYAHESYSCGQSTESMVDICMR